MAGKVKIVINSPEKAPKVVEYAEIKDQGRIPYGKTADAPIPRKLSRRTARGMGAAVKGGSYLGYS
jgi:hypothetical protein